MGCCKKWCLVSIAALAILFGYAAHCLYSTAPVPKLNLDQYWGPGKAVKTPDTSVRPFKVQFKPERIEKLKQQLSDNDWYTDPLEGVGFNYGINEKYLSTILDFWSTKYNFSEREAYLNKYPQFKTKIQGLDIHFIHIKQKPKNGVRVVPLLLLHGWPGSFVEFHKIVPLLMAEDRYRNYVFDIIVPSLPGYGYSQAAAKPGLGSSQMAVVMRNLMKRLGYNSYVIQGGDWGSIVTATMAILFPEEVYGYHTNMPFIMSGIGSLKLFLGSIYPPMVIEKKHESKVYPLSKIFSNLILESGYFHIQATKPDTVGVGLLASPVGLAAYILEKFSVWTNPEWKDLQDGGLTKKFDLSELLDNVMIYWDSRCITTSMRLYSETFNKAHMALNFFNIPVPIPTAVARFSNEIVFSPKWQMSDRFPNLIQLSDLEGGHFAAFEEPQALAKDIFLAMTAFDNYHKKTKKQEL